MEATPALAPRRPFENPWRTVTAGPVAGINAFAFRLGCSDFSWPPPDPARNTTREDDEGDCVLHPASIVRKIQPPFSTNRQRPFADRSDNALIVPRYLPSCYPSSKISPDFVWFRNDRAIDDKSTIINQYSTSMYIYMYVCCNNNYY